MRHLMSAMGAAAMVSAGPALAETGPVTVWFDGEAPAVSDRLAILCADRNAAVVEQDDRHLLCQREVSGAKGIVAQAMLGNSYSTEPQLMIRFALLRDGKAIRVQASQWIELQMAGGQTRRTALDARKQRQELENVLIGAGAHNVPPHLLDEPAAAPTPPPAGD